MKNTLVAAALAALMLTGCSTVRVRHGFTVNDYVGVALEYATSHDLAGVNTFGPMPKEFDCQRTAATVVGDAQGRLVPGHRLAATCLHVALKGPLGKHGAVVPQPFSGTPLTVVAIGVEYSRAGKFFGAQPLHAAPDVKTCVWQAHDVIDSNQKAGKVPLGNSLLVYCLPIPFLPPDAAPPADTLAPGSATTL
jgi:hypothetical protein